MDNLELFNQIEKELSSVQQSRSRFQLDKFVLGQHPTPEMQYYQILLELQNTIFNYRLAKIQIEKSKLKAKKLESSNKEMDKLKLEEHRISLRQSEIGMASTERELTHLLEIWNSFEHKYTREEIEAAQPDYWRARLTNNAKAMLMSGAGVNYAHIESMEQAGALQEFIEAVEQSKKELE
jgi:hypothetical protein